MVETPPDRNLVEVRILNCLNDTGHAVDLNHLRKTLVPDKEDTVVCTMFDLRGEGLVNIFDITGGKMIEITAAGKTALLETLKANRHRCS